MVILNCFILMVSFLIFQMLNVYYFLVKKLGLGRVTNTQSPTRLLYGLGTMKNFLSVLWAFMMLKMNVYFYRVLDEEKVFVITTMNSTRVNIQNGL